MTEPVPTADIPPLLSRPLLSRSRQTKIVATLGPSSSTQAAIRDLLLAGVDVFRLNFSHGTHEDHARRMDAIRTLETQYDHPIAVMADLQGPKLRIGRFAGGSVTLTPGQGFRLDRAPAAGDATRVALPHDEVFAAVSKGQSILLDDGKVRLRVRDIGADHIDTMVEAGTTLSDRKGVNLPETLLTISPLTTKDRGDLAAALDMGVDWIALSFVQRPEDLSEPRRLIAGRARLLSKIEKPSAVRHLDALVEQSDAIMVARGDLGVEMPPEDVPGQQKRIVRACRQAGKPVIVATQMLESMINAPTPTRAEASDVATAVYDGADAVMLSAETAAGAYPVEAVGIMSRIAAKVESDPLYRKILESERYLPEETTADAITAAARQVAHTARAAAIVTYTASGSTTLRAARERPEVPILSLTSSLETARRLALCWGVRPVHAPDIDDFGQMVDCAISFASARGLAHSGQRLVITAGVPFGVPGTTNVLRVAWVE